MANGKKGSGLSGIVASEFDTYDTFGYFIPGTVLVVGLYALSRINGFAEGIKLEQYLTGAENRVVSWPAFLGIVPIVILLIYVVGHFVASLSAVLIDKLIVERTLGYPFYRLFKKALHYTKSPVLRYMHRGQQFYKSLLVIFVVMIILAGVNVNRTWLIVSMAIFILVFFAKLAFSMLCLSDWHDSNSVRDDNSRCMKFVERAWPYCRTVLWPLYGFVFPLTVFSVLSLLFRMCKPFEHEFQERFAQKFQATFGMKLEEAGTNVYWLTYSYLHQNDKDNIVLIRHWLNLYAFARNLSTAFLLLFAYSVWMMRANENTDREVAFVCCIGVGISAIVFWLRYYYLYYNYYSKYLFRSFFSLK